MRAAMLLLPLLLAACKDEPDFDSRYEAASEEIEARARALDAAAQKAGAEAGGVPPDSGSEAGGAGR